MKDIYTVIGMNDASGSLFTVSFLTFDKAKEYIVREVLESDDGSISTDEILNSLEQNMFYDDGNTKYYVEKAKLI